MLPHAVARRSSERWSQTCSEGRDGAAWRRSPSSMSWRGARDELVPRHSADLAARSWPRDRPGPSASSGRAFRRRSGNRRTRSRAARRRHWTTGTPRQPPRGRRVSAGPRRRGARRARPSASSHERVVPARIAQSSEGVTSSAPLGYPSSSSPDQEDVGRRALGEMAVEGQEQRVVGTGPACLEARVDVVGARRRLEGRRAGWPDRAGSPTRRGAGRARDGPPARERPARPG